jgi:predicted permease
VPAPAVLDPRTLVFVAVTTLAVALITGLAPAAHAARSDLAGALKEGSVGSGSRRSRASTLLMLFQGALSVLLLVGAGLFLRSLQNVQGMRMGYDTDSLVMVGANMRGAKLSDAARVALDERMLAAAQHVPGVENAALAASVPFWSFEGRGTPYVVGKDSLDRLGSFTYQAASPSYFATVGTRILRGRGLLPSDQKGSAPIAVISKSMADAIWPGENALGKQFRVGSDSEPFLTVVGVAEDVHGERLSGDPEYWYYLPVAQTGESTGQLFVRVRGRPADAVASLRKALQALMPGAAYVTATPLPDLVGPEQRSWKQGATMFTAFGVLALALAALGLYSVIAYAVAQRTRELGVRIALGARASEIRQMVLRQGLALALLGIAAGSVLALLASRWMTPLLFEESPRDPWVFGAVAAVLVAVAAAASLLPALRASRVDPARVLRTD